METCLSNQNKHNEAVIDPHGEFKPIVMNIK